jgi:hypothetical protein
MSLSVRSAGLIRALIYPVQFDENPLEAVDRVIDTGHKSAIFRRDSRGIPSWHS